MLLVWAFPCRPFKIFRMVKMLTTLQYMREERRLIPALPYDLLNWEQSLTWYYFKFYMHIHVLFYFNLEIQALKVHDFFFFQKS